MKSTVLLLSVGLALANAEGFFNWGNASPTQAIADVAARDAADQDQAPGLGDAALELGHCEGGKCGKKDPLPTVTKVCKECVTVTKTCTIKVPDPTTFVKTRMCTTTMIRSRTVTKCIDHTKTDTKYCPVTKTSVQTVTVEPTCTPKPCCHRCLASQTQHVVEAGEDCETIAAVYNTTVEDLQVSNTWLNGTCNLKAGDTLCIPEAETDAITQQKRDVAHHHHHHHDHDDEDGGMTCDGDCQKKKQHHHHHGHHHHGHRHGHHHHGHHHHHHKDKGGDKCESEGCGEKKHHHHHGHHHHGHHHGHNHGHHHHGHHHDHDDDHKNQSCGDHHECVACTVPGTCPRDGIHAACPDNFMCQEIQSAVN